MSDEPCTTDITVIDTNAQRILAAIAGLREQLTELGTAVQRIDDNQVFVLTELRGMTRQQAVLVRRVRQIEDR